MRGLPSGQYDVYLIGGAIHDGSEPRIYNANIDIGINDISGPQPRLGASTVGYPTWIENERYMLETISVSGADDWVSAVLQRGTLDFSNQIIGLQIVGGLPSDLNSNGFVDFQDLTILLANWNKDVTADDGNLVEPLTTVVNFADLTVLLADWTGPGPAGSPKAALGAEAVPEPSSLFLLAIATLGLSFYRRRRRRAF